MIMKRYLLLSLLSFLTLCANASNPVEINGVYYNLVSKVKTAEVTKNPNELYSGEVVIPETVTYDGTEYNVTSIGDYIFYFCSGLTSVTIPKSVTSIGQDAFYECRALTSVHISDIEAWCNISFYGESSNPLLWAHHLYLNGEKIKDLVIPNSMTSIGNYVFTGGSGLTSVTIPNSVTSIGDYAFSGCSGLTSVTIPNSVTSIGSCAFSQCSGLTSITIPNSVTSIGSSAFCLCSGLTSVTIPNSVTYILDSAFSQCSGLTSVTIPNSVTSIGGYAFGYCSGLTSVTIPNSVTSIGDNAFYDCSGLTIVTIGSGVNSIGKESFSQCPELTDVYCFASTPPDARVNVFEGSYTEYATLHVPENSVDAYKATTPWSGFKEVVAISSSGISKLETSETVVKCEGDQLTVEGINDGQIVDVYSLNGEKLGSVVSKNGAACIDTNVHTGSVVVVKMGKKSVKVIVK